MPQTSPAGNGADALLEQLERQGVDCIFASPIAVMAPIWEALARRGDRGGARYRPAGDGAGSDRAPQAGLRAPGPAD